MAAFIDREAEVADSSSDDDDDDDRKSSKRKHGKDKSANKKAKTEAKKSDGANGESSSSDNEGSSSGSSSSSSSSSSGSDSEASEIENSDDEPPDNEEVLRKEMAGFVVENEDEEEVDDDAVGAKTVATKTVDDEDDEDDVDQPQKEVEDELEEDDYELINENLGVRNKPRRIRIEDDSDEEGQLAGNDNRIDDEEANSPTAMQSAAGGDRFGKKVSRHDSSVSGDRDTARGGEDANDEGESGAEDEDDEDNFIVDDQGNPMKLKLGGKGMSGWQHQSLQEAQEIFGLDFDVEDLEAMNDSDMRLANGELEAGEDDFEDNYEYDEDEYGALVGAKHRRKVRKDLSQLYEAAELERNYLTSYDEKIRNEDVPERFLTRRVPVVPLIKPDDAPPKSDPNYAVKDAEAEWMYHTLRQQAIQPMLLVGNESREVRPVVRFARDFENRDKLVKAIREVVGFIREEKVEVPFISAYRKEMIETLRDEDLWYIYDLDEQYTVLIQRRETLQRLMRTMLEFVKAEIAQAELSQTHNDENMLAKLPAITDEMIDLVGRVETIEQLQDYYRYFMTYYGDHLNRARIFKATQNLRPPSAAQATGVNGELVTAAVLDAPPAVDSVPKPLTTEPVVFLDDAVDDEKNFILRAEHAPNAENAAAGEPMEGVVENVAEPAFAASQLVISEGENGAVVDAAVPPDADKSTSSTTVTLTAPASPASPLQSAAAGSTTNSSPSRNNRRRAVIDEDDDDRSNDGNAESNGAAAVVKSKKSTQRTGDDDDDDEDDDEYTPEGAAAKKLAKNAAALHLDEDAEATSVATPASSQIPVQHHLPTRRDSYLQTFMRQRIDEFVTRHFGVDLYQFATGVAGGQARNVLKHQEYTDPDEVASRYIGTHYHTSKQVKKAGIILLAVQMANFPLLRAAIRDKFFQHAKISVRPTAQGARDIDENHNCYRVKYLTNKLISRLKPEDFAAIHAAAQAGLLRYKLALDNVESLSGDPKVPPKMVTADNRQLRTLSGVGGINTHSMPSSAIQPAMLPHGTASGSSRDIHHPKQHPISSASTPFIVTIKDYLLKDEYREEVQNWNKLRVLALQVALDDHLYPHLEKELESRLLREANDMILRKIYAEVENVVMMKPFRPVLSSKGSSVVPSGGSGGSRPTDKRPDKQNAGDAHLDLSASDEAAERRRLARLHEEQLDSHSTIDSQEVSTLNPLDGYDDGEEISSEWALGENDKNLRVMGISWDKTVNESGGVYAVVVNRWGEVLNRLPLRRFLISTDWRDQQFKQEDLSELDRLVHESKPQCVAIMGGGLECERLQDDLKQLLSSMKETNSIIPSTVENVIIVDPGTAQKFQTSLEWKGRFKDPSPMFLSAVGVARRLLDPLLAFAQLCTYEEDLLNVTFHPMQKQMPHDELRNAIMRPIIGAVNYVGVDFNEVIDHQETLMPLLQFVCGLGPRRGPHILKMIMRNTKTGHINNREQLKSHGGATEVIFKNMAGFVRFTRGNHEHEQGDEVNDYWYALDKTRIHPDNDQWVQKIAGDALDKEDDDTIDKKQLLEEVMLPQNADALQQLDLDSFADFLEADFGKKNLTLHLIRQELLRPFEDKRAKYSAVGIKQLFSIVVGEPAELYEQGRLAKVCVIGGRNYIFYKRPKPDRAEDFKPQRGLIDSMYYCPLCRRMLGEDPGDAARHVLSASNSRPVDNKDSRSRPLPQAVNPGDCPGEPLWVVVKFDSGIFGRVYADCLTSSSPETRKPIENYIKPNQVLMGRIMQTKFHERLRGFSCMLTTRSKDLAGPKLRVSSEIDPEFTKLDPDAPRTKFGQKTGYFAEIDNPVFERDADYDKAAEKADDDKRSAKHNQAQQAARALKMTRRVITHPNFKNIDYAQCDKLMESMDAGECVFRPSSKGYEHLTVSIKLLPNVVMHVDIKEEGKVNPFSLGKRLIIAVGSGSGGAPRFEEFEDLDEIKARFVDVVASNVREVTSHRYYFFKPKPPSTATEAEAAATTAEPPCYADSTRVVRYLTDEKERQPARIPYCMSPSRDFPGRFMLAYMPRRDRPPSIEWFKVAFDGFIYRQKTLPSVASMLAYFKDHFNEAPPQASQNSSQSNASHQHHNDAFARRSSQWFDGIADAACWCCW